MTIYNYKEYNSLCICGDIHGEFKTLMFNIKRLGISDSVIIVAGDCGIGFEKEAHYTQLYNKIRKTLETTNNILLLVRGNHDDPTYFNEKPIDFERMKTIADYSVINTSNNTTLCIGGAISIDRLLRLDEMRIKRLSSPIYWVNEPVVYDEEKLSKMSNLKIDTVITHSCPSFCYPSIKAGIERSLLYDAELSNDLQQERVTLDKIYEHIIKDDHPLKNWFYGHYHQSHSEYIKDINFTLLGIMEIKPVYETISRL